MKRFYVKWSNLYQALCVYDRQRKNPEGGSYLIASSDTLQFTNAEEFCRELNSENKELFEQYGIPDIYPVS